MGEARRRQAVAAHRRDELNSAVERVGSALRRLMTAASAQHGSDCFVHAAIGQLLLADLGFEAELVVGEAAWRVGPGDGDVISHTPRVQGYLPPGAMGFAYHAWLTVDSCIVDFTTYQLARKGKDLDAADGGTTQVNWCPHVLVLPFEKVKSYAAVASAYESGVAFYGPHPELHAMLATQYEVDGSDLAAARLLLASPDMQAIGPNDR